MHTLSIVDLAGRVLIQKKMVFNKCGMLFTRLGRQLVRLFATLPFGRRIGKQDEGLNDRDRNTQSHKNFVQGVHVLS